MCFAMLLLCCLFNKPKKQKIQVWVEGAGLWTLYAFFITEVLSHFSAISRKSLFAAWVALDLLLVICIIMKYRLWGDGLQKCISNIRDSWKSSLPRRHPKLAIAWVIFAAGIIILALFTVPSNWDSQTYHLSRIYHWAQNGSVAHYATNIVRQDSSPVLAEFIGLHVYLLTGSGKGALNLIQCVSYLTSGLLVLGISRRLKLSKSSCIAAAMLFYACPIAMAEALTTQVDELATFWCLCFVYLIVDFLKPEEKISIDKSTLGCVFIMALSIAFGYLAKPSMLFAILIFLIWLLIMMLRRKDSPKVIGYIVFAAVTVLAVLTPEWLRNLKTFDALASSATGARQLVGTLNPKYLFISFLKNFTFNMPTTLFHQSDNYIYMFVRAAASMLGVGLNSASISEDGKEFSVTAAPNYGCDTAISPNIVWGILIGIIIVIVCFKKARAEKEKMGYFFIATVTYMVFCVFVMWEPYVGRYMLTYLALLCPAIGCALDFLKLKMSRNGVAAAKGAVFFLCAVEILSMFAFHAYTAKRYQGDYGFFASNRSIYSDYQQMTEIINTSGCTTVGLWVGEDSYEYPLTQMISDNIRIEHVNVNNVTTGYADTSFTPDFVIVYNLGTKDQVTVNGIYYQQVVSFEKGSLWKKTG